MAVVTAEESRAGQRDVYVPADATGMAHRSYPSPDRKWALVVEMNGPWLPCRLVSLEGNPQSRPAGPSNGGCTFAAWSPDGKWMYFSASAGGGFHCWRQPFPDGKPQQITSGPTEEEGIAMSPDGRSFVTSVGVRQSPVWIHDQRGDRQLSLEGYAYEPKFTPDGKKLLYRVGTATAPTLGPAEATALWVADLDTGHTEPLLPGFPVFGGPNYAYDISADGKTVVVQAPDAKGKSRLWLAPLDRHAPIRQLPGIEGEGPSFTAGGDILFRDREAGPMAPIYSVRQDGTGLRMATSEPASLPRGVSPDGQWLVARKSDSSELLFPMTGGLPVRFADGQDFRLRWTADRKTLLIRVMASYPWGDGRTYAVPLKSGHIFPEMPHGGFRSESDLQKLPGVQIIDAYDVAPGPTGAVYAYSRETVQRNLYRIPLP
jgi:hypothetical protein